MSHINLYDITVPQQIHMLKSLSSILTKVQTQVETQTPASTWGTEKPLPSNLDHLNLSEVRLAPDMKPFPFQITTICNNAKLTAVRIGDDIQNVEEADTQTTFPELLTRIEKTIGFLQGLKREQFEAKEEKEEAEKKIVLFGYEFTRLTYVTQYALPNFYFHLSMAFAILRGMGFDIGKMDFLGAGEMKKVAE